jgi:hypothetical protein
VVVSLLKKDEPMFYFLNSNRWWFHGDFISRFLVNFVNGALVCCIGNRTAHWQICNRD